MRIQKLLQRFSRSGARSGSAPAQDAPAASGAPGQTRVKRRKNPMDRLELQSAVIHHLEWCVLFNEHLSLEEHHDPHLTPLPPAAGSELGLWLERIRSSLSAPDPQLEVLAAEHVLFHQVAQQALGWAHQGRMDMASTLLNTDFERSRARVLDLLRQMQKA